MEIEDIVPVKPHQYEEQALIPFVEEFIKTILEKGILFGLVNADDFIVTTQENKYKVLQIEQKYNDTIFYKDYLTSFYSKELIDVLNNQWTKERIRIILDLITFLTISPVLESNVKSLETIMENNDVNSQNIIMNI
jgi:hypothetical protein